MICRERSRVFITPADARSREITSNWIVTNRLAPKLLRKKFRTITIRDAATAAATQFLVLHNLSTRRTAAVSFDFWEYDGVIHWIGPSPVALVMSWIFEWAKSYEKFARGARLVGLLYILNRSMRIYFWRFSEAVDAWILNLWGNGS